MTDLEREYSPSSRVGGSAQPFIDDYVERSRTARAMMADWIHVLDDGTLLAMVDDTSPLLVFVHGGYWQALSAEASLYPVPAALGRGWSYAALEYTLAPAATLDQMVAECAAGLRSLVERHPWREVVVAGHSAGAHLVAMVTLTAVDPVPVDRVVLLSGVFDLRPLVHTSVNERLGLDEVAAAACSPGLMPVTAGSDGPHVIVAWGDDETDAFKEQGASFAHHLRDSGVAVDETEAVGRHHFDIVDDLLDTSTPIGSFALGDTE